MDDETDVMSEDAHIVHLNNEYQPRAPWRVAPTNTSCLERRGGERGVDGVGRAEWLHRGPTRENGVGSASLVRTTTEGSQTGPTTAGQAIYRKPIHPGTNLNSDSRRNALEL